MKQKKPLLTVTLILVLIVLFVVVYLLYSNLSQDYQPEAEGTSESQEQEHIKAPDFEVLDSEGNTVSLYDFIGSPIVINYWASWCGPCKMEMPDFNEAYSEVRKDVLFMMINVVDGKRETESSGREYVENQGFDFPVFYDIGLEASLSYSITSYPTTLFIDKDGYLIGGYTGMIDKQTLLDAIELIAD